MKAAKFRFVVIVFIIGSLVAIIPFSRVGAQEMPILFDVLAISVDNTTSAAVDGGSSLSWLHTVNSGSNGILIVNVSFLATEGAVTSVEYGGTALTLLGSAVRLGGGDIRTEMWYLKAPAAGTANVVITMNASMTFTGGATNFFGVDQTTPTGTFVGANGSGHTPSVTVASASGEVVIDAVADRAGVSGTVGANQTDKYRETIGSGGGSVWGSSSTEAGAASVTMSWSLSGTGAGEWAAVAVALKPSTNSDGDIETITDLVLERRGDLADVYYPAKPTSLEGFPVVAVLQGAGVDKGFYSGFGRQLARFGFVVVIPNHFQSIPSVPFPVLFPDQDMILDVLAQMVTEDGDASSPLSGMVDTTRMGLVGHSAGGAAGLFAINESCFPPFCIPTPPFFSFTLPEAVRVGTFYGTNTCGAGGEAEDPACINFDTIPPNPTGMLFTIDNNNIPVALVQGSVDGIGTPAEAQATIEALAALRKLVIIKGANHYGITDENNPAGAVPDFSPPLIPQEKAIIQIALASGQFLSTYLKGEQIPGEFPVFSNKLDVDSSVTMNGRLVAKGTTGADSVIDIDGNRDTVNQFLPDLVPSVFPANTSEVKVTDQDSPFVSDTAVFYKEVEIDEGQTASFNGGGPFHIDTIKVKRDAILNLGAGTYFVKKLEIADDDARINITSEPVTLHIGKELKLDAKRLIVNAEGTVAGFRVYLHRDVEFKGVNLNFTGVIYGPEGRKAEVEKTTLRGAVIISGEVKLKKETAITYTEEDQRSVSATIITP